MSGARYASIFRLNGALGPAVEVNLGVTGQQARTHSRQDRDGRRDRYMIGRRRGRSSQIRYGLGLIAAVGALVAVHVVPKLEDYRLSSGGSPVERTAGASVDYAGSTWRLISFSLVTDDQVPKGTSDQDQVVHDPSCRIEEGQR
jgi:hypothetical protein